MFHVRVILKQKEKTVPRSLTWIRPTLAVSNAISDTISNRENCSRRRMQNKKNPKTCLQVTKARCIAPCQFHSIYVPSIDALRGGPPPLEGQDTGTESQDNQGPGILQPGLVKNRRYTAGRIVAVPAMLTYDVPGQQSPISAVIAIQIGLCCRGCAQRGPCTFANAPSRA